MKVTLPDLTTIECTVDEYEELVARGLIGKKLEDLKIDLGLGEDKKITVPRAPKYPPAWDQVVALYGCQIAQNDYNGSIDVKFEHNAYTTTDGVQKLNSVVINDASNTDEE